MARERVGGSYEMNHTSFGAMMVSEQLRPALVAVTELIRAQARVNTQASSSGGSTQEDESVQHLADSYKRERGPLVVLVVGGRPAPRISERVVNPLRHAAAREFGLGRPKASTKGLRGRKKKAVLQADVYGPAQYREGTRDLRRAGARFGDLGGSPE